MFICQIYILIFSIVHIFLTGVGILHLDEDMAIAGSLHCLLLEYMKYKTWSNTKLSFKTIYQFPIFVSSVIFLVSSNFVSRLKREIETKAAF